MNPHTAKLVNGNVKIAFNDVGPGWEQWFMLSGDRHHDNIHCNRELETRHLRLAREREALIIDVGDLFCSMQGRYDPRSSMSDIRIEDVGADYLDRLVKHAAEDYGPYARNFLVLGKGNHEAAALKNNHVDLTSNLAHRLTSDFGGRPFVGGIGGWVGFFFTARKTVRKSFLLKYQHGGAGTDSPVTRGLIQTNRQAVYQPDADFVVNGHTHDSYIVPIAREHCDRRSLQSTTRSMVFLRTPTYEDYFGDGRDGWWNLKMKAPKSLGCIWMRFYYDPDMIVRAEFILDVV